MAKPTWSGRGPRGGRRRRPGGGCRRRPGRGRRDRRASPTSRSPVAGSTGPGVAVAVEGDRDGGRIGAGGDHEVVAEAALVAEEDDVDARPHAGVGDVARRWARPSATPRVGAGEVVGASREGGAGAPRPTGRSRRGACGGVRRTHRGRGRHWWARGRGGIRGHEPRSRRRPRPDHVGLESEGKGRHGVEHLARGWCPGRRPGRRRSRRGGAAPHSTGPAQGENQKDQ